MDKQNSFEAWGIIDLFGHSRIAGKISEAQIGGCSFVRVDVPEVKGCAAFTKFYGNGAIYAVTITDEETARIAAGYYQEKPVEEWTFRNLLIEHSSSSLAEPEEVFREDELPF